MTCVTAPFVLAFMLGWLGTASLCYPELARGVSMPLKPIGLWPYLTVIGLTVALELIVYGLTLSSRYRGMRLLALSVRLNLLTHPVITFAFPHFFASSHGSYGSMIACGEAYAILGEAFLLLAEGRVRAKQAVFASGLANIASWTVGAIIINPFVPWLTN